MCVYTFIQLFVSCSYFYSLAHMRKHTCVLGTVRMTMVDPRSWPRASDRGTISSFDRTRITFNLEITFFHSCGLISLVLSAVSIKIVLCIQMNLTTREKHGRREFRTRRHRYNTPKRQDNEEYWFQIIDRRRHRAEAPTLLLRDISHRQSTQRNSRKNSYTPLGLITFSNSANYLLHTPVR